ncbi:hypothetical protein CWATWH0003_0776 [Crocosphaera watsonii WH 0003]|uniref:Uncharacterized protein n=2 Tax=Crocosphaera watsonii TaxID=263511 RepID=G5IZT8_CROWT|nr:hypothetical protein CWATWH0003_0776 [Crocosphaera watsonii WH 0003]CCQ54809.1 hypothetical protein CWATWH0005_1140 [Crocosphaera watsonii WH 0005]
MWDWEGRFSRSQSQFRKGEKLICDRQIPLKHPEKIAKA